MKHRAGLGKLNTSGRSNQQLDTEVALKVLNMNAERRLSDIEAGSRSAKMQLFGERHE